MGGDAAGLKGPERASAVRRLGPPVLIVVLGTVAATLVTPWLATSSAPLAQPQLSLPVLFALWLPFELVMLFLLFGDDVDNADTFMLTEIPLVLGLLFASPTDLLVVGVGTPVLVDLVRHRKTALKQVFNGVNRAFEVSLALAVYRLLDPADPLSTGGWLTLAAAATFSSVVTSLAVSLVISLALGWLPRRDFWAHVLLSVPMAVGGSTIGFCAALALQAGTVAALPLLGALVILLLLLGGLTVMTERHLHLVRLQALGHRLSTASDVTAILATSLEASAHLLLGRRSTAYLPSPGDDWALRRIDLGPDRSLQESAVPKAQAPAVPGGGGRRRRVVAAARSGADAADGSPPDADLILCVEGRPRSLRPFGAEDVRVLDMVAQQAARALHTTRLVEQLRHDALHDPLTMLPNRRSFLHTLEDRLSRGERLAVALVRARDLETVNAALGHDHGDDLLVEIAQRLCAGSGPGSVVARVGGDGFAVLLPLPARRGSRSSVEPLLATLSRPFTMSGVDVLARACAGVAETGPDADVTARDLLRRADIAMRFARRTGRDVEVYTAELDTATPERLSLAADLQTGLTRGELTLHAQPQVRLADGAVTGVEMLVRWNHPVRGFLPPGEFIPVAEQTGLDRPLTAWVLNAALKTLARWRADGLDLTVSVNVPPSALEDSQLIELIDELLTLRGLDGAQLVVELTESSLLTNFLAATEVLEGLSHLGVKVSVDDFGTGFSSLSHLRRLPVDEIKIDRSFVGTMLQSNDDAAIVRSVIELARALGLACVAEGIEDEEVYAALQRLGCDSAQGYLMAAPMPVEDVPGWLRSRRPVAPEGEQRAASASVSRR
ncbi:MAG TPA: bifunctional diguanylate cyclase/phosphodiesterase [Nocardioidaceae bacterium]|nr:bifunctional diguanylate cyclase/phosphodiesterase [Nocardioidaceae bacterium]